MSVNELEKLANSTNLNLRKNKEALILKVPVPIILTNKGLIAKKSTVDFTGLIKGGTFIAYDAKETLNKTSFPLRNIEEHQLLYLDFVYELGGFAFFLIHFKSIYPDEMFITPIPFIKKYWNDQKSIKLSEFNLNWLTKIENYLNKIKEMENELRNI